MSGVQVPPPLPKFSSAISYLVNRAAARLIYIKFDFQTNPESLSEYALIVYRAKSVTDYSADGGQHDLLQSHSKDQPLVALRRV